MRLVWILTASIFLFGCSTQGIDTKSVQFAIDTCAKLDLPAQNISSKITPAGYHIVKFECYKKEDGNVNSSFDIEYAERPTP